MKLTGKASVDFASEPFLARIERRSTSSHLSLRNIGEIGPRLSSLFISDEPGAQGEGTVQLSAEFAYLTEGDILRINPSAGEVRVLYRRHSRHNFLFFTERCNSRCLMCSQPPRDTNDDYLVEEILRMIPWMARDTPELGITGGEPTLLHHKLVEVITAAKQYLPQTSLHLLSNGRLFSHARHAQEVGAIGHPDFMVGIPLYADIASVHDFVVQARGAFDQTIFGLLNLARSGVRIELRVVIHQQTFARLADLAHFVARNLPFVHQVSLMGLELTGFTRSNLSALWIDPADYQGQLEECVEALDSAGLAVSIFNHQLCVLRPSLRRFSRKAISDWKNIYLPLCDECALRHECGGFFASSLLRHSAHLKPIQASSINSL